MKILFLWLMAILLIIGSTNEANARSKKKKGKAKTEQQTDSVQKKKRGSTTSFSKIRRNIQSIKGQSQFISTKIRFIWNYRLN